MSEARDPQRDVPFAMLISFLSVTLIYVLVQIVVIRVLENPGQTDRPLAMAAQIFLGPTGAAFIAISALLGLFGYLSANMVHVPRTTFALAEQGDLPPVFAAVHNRFKTPHVSILIFAVSLWALATMGNFRWNVVLSSASRLITYGLVCASLLALRRKQPAVPAYRLPLGSIFAVIGIALMIVLFTRITREELAWILATGAVAFLNWTATRTTSWLLQPLASCSGPECVILPHRTDPVAYHHKKEKLHAQNSSRNVAAFRRSLGQSTSPHGGHRYHRRAGAGLYQRWATRSQ